MHIVRRALTMTIILSLTFVFGTAANAGHWSCDVNTQKPHWSTGANGVITKGRITCTKDTNWIGVYLRLYFCGSQYPQAEKWWLIHYCSPVGENGNDIDDPKANKDYFRYAPPLGQSGVRMTGWYRGYGFWTVKDTHNGQVKEANYDDPSPAAYCRVSAADCD